MNHYMLSFILLAIVIFPGSLKGETIYINNGNKWQTGLNIIAEQVNSGNRSFEGDILIIEDVYYDETLTQPIGTKKYPFKGTIRGNGAKITLEYDNTGINNPQRKDHQYLGIFGYTEDAEIYHLRCLGKAESEYIPQNNHHEEKFGYAGFIAGYAKNTVIQGCIVESDEIFGFKDFSKGKTNYRQHYICGETDEQSLIRNNYVYHQDLKKVSSDETGKNTLNGQLTDYKYIQIGSNNEISIDLNAGYNGKAFLCFNPDLTLDIKNTNVWIQEAKLHSFDLYAYELSLHPTASISGHISAKTVHLYDECYIEDLHITDCEKIIYHRDFETFAERNGNGSGWQTIILPFDAVLYVEETPIHPVLSNKSGKYWLRQYCPEESQNGEVCFKSLSTDDFEGGMIYIKKNTPYIIALPGESYGSNSLADKKGKISFRTLDLFEGEVDIQTSTYQIGDESNTFVFIGNLNKLDSSSNTKYYILNNPSEETHDVNNGGSKGAYFKIKDFNPVNGVNNGSLRNRIKPFRAYFKESSVSVASTPARLNIVDRPSVPNSMDLTAENGAGIRAYAYNGNIYIQAEEECKTQLICALTGRVLKNITIGTQTPEVISGLNKGVYVVAGKKIVL